MAILRCKTLYAELAGGEGQKKLSVRSDLVIHFKVRAFALVKMSLEAGCMHMLDDPVPCGDVVGHFL